MKVGDLVRYRYVGWCTKKDRDTTGVVLVVNDAGGTLKILDTTGQTGWVITSYCEVINESR